ncbi:hypothetical protein EMPS_01436 [Entomortierella parvispora]|uniref:Uncharacterized protein n=1 Tax=Entomortierella parvispora TaxID=205924 RepID=A0A9P3H2V6_9FUNG|nr:hypothetical protein EMPS_01436 [Entomortierella parvispora]
MAEKQPQQFHASSRQPIIAVDTSATAPTAASDSIQPMAIPGAGRALTTDEPISPTSPSKSLGKKTGTRSTFCPNTLRKGTKLTEEDYEHHEKVDPQPTGWLQMLGLKKSANFGEAIDKGDEPHHQSYY